MDDRFMRLAIAEARKSEPEDGRIHPKVGAVLVQPDGSITKAFRGEIKPGEHAEYTLLERKLEKSIVAGSVAYVTLEPCTERNPPKICCAERMAERRIRTVWVGMLDPDHRICGRGVSQMRNAGIEVRFFGPEPMSMVEDINRNFIRAKTDELQAVKSHLSPPEEAAALDCEACEHLAASYASRGDNARATEWGLRAFLQLTKTSQVAKIGTAALFLALQYRHQGSFNESLRYYAQAEDSIRKLGTEDFDTKFNLLRISSGRSMVERFLLLGDANASLHAYSSIASELEDLESDFRLTDAQRATVETYSLHFRRQRAELYRQLGRYEESLGEFKSVYEHYSYIEVGAKAWSLLGRAEAARMAGRTDEAKEFYEGAERFASRSGDTRLAARILRSRAELARFLGESPTQILRSLLELVENRPYLYGRIYLALSRGGSQLDSGDYSSAALSFLEARALARANGRELGIEAIHGKFGLAEAYRLQGRQEETVKLLQHAHNQYNRKGIVWGTLRTELVLSSITKKQMPPQVDTADANYTQLLDLEIDNRTAFTNLL